MAGTSIQKLHPLGLKDLEMEIPLRWCVHIEREFGDVDLYILGLVLKFEYQFGVTDLPK
jgi:hypothetical protein